MQMTVTNKIQGRTGGGILKTAEIARTQVERFANPSTPRGKAALTLSGRKLAQRLKQLQELPCQTK